MKYLLDTNVCVAVLRGKKPLVTARLSAHPPSDVVVCSVVVGELCVGAAKTHNPATEQAKVDGFLAAFQSLRSTTKRPGATPRFAPTSKPSVR